MSTSRRLLSRLGNPQRWAVIQSDLVFRGRSWATQTRSASVCAMFMQVTMVKPEPGEIRDPSCIPTFKRRENAWRRLSEILVLSGSLGWVGVTVAYVCAEEGVRLERYQCPSITRVGCLSVMYPVKPLALRVAGRISVEQVVTWHWMRRQHPQKQRPNKRQTGPEEVARTNLVDRLSRMRLQVFDPRYL